MEKPAQPDSLPTVTGKDYSPPPSEYGPDPREPPPAYRRPDSSALQIARLAAATALGITLLIGFFFLGAVYIQAAATCTQQQPDITESPIPSSAALVDDQSVSETKDEPPLPEQKSNSIDEEEGGDGVRMPIQIDFDDLAGLLMDTQSKARMNCVVERRRSEGSVNRRAKTLVLPMGINMTRDPRKEAFSGERMEISCESGREHRVMPPAEPQPPQQQQHHQSPHMVVIPLQGQALNPLRNIMSLLPRAHSLMQSLPFHLPMQMREIPIQMREMPIQMRELPIQVKEIPIQMREIPIHMREIPIHMRELPIQLRQLPVQMRELPLHVRPISPQMPAQVQPPSIHLSPPAPEPRALRVPLPLPIHQEQQRPHYVQPRSIREPAPFQQHKRVKRCACDCAC